VRRSIKGLPWLSGIHTPDEDRRFYREQLFALCKAWGAVEQGTLVGVIAFHDD